MTDKRSVFRFTPSAQNEVEVVFEGATKMTGKLRDISQFGAYFYADGAKPDVEKCFLRLYMHDDEYYSRGTIIRMDENGMALKLENWFPIYAKLAEQDVLSRNTTLAQILRHKSTKEVLSDAEKMFSEHAKSNCWEAMQCGKEQYCAAGTDSRYDGLLGGKNGGRFCAFIADTLCKDGVPRDTPEKAKLCNNCSFYQNILSEFLTDTTDN